MVLRRLLIIAGSLLLLTLKPCLAESTIGCLLFVPPTGAIDLGDKGELELPVAQSIVVGFADPAGPAYKAGLRAFDVITHIEGQSIENEKVALEIIAKLDAGRPATFKYQRPSIARSRIAWHNRTARVKPIDRIVFLKGVVVSYEHPPTGAIHHTHYSERAATHRVTQITAGLVEDSGRTTPFLGATYVAEDWLFAKKLIFVCGNDRVEVEPLEWHHENAADVIWEWSITPAQDGSTARECLEAVSRGEVDNVVFNGQTYYHEHPVSPYEAYKARVLLDYWRLVQLPKERP